MDRKAPGELVPPAVTAPNAGTGGNFIAHLVEYYDLCSLGWGAAGKDNFPHSISVYVAPNWGNALDHRRLWDLYLGYNLERGLRFNERNSRRFKVISQNTVIVAPGWVCQHEQPAILIDQQTRIRKGVYREAPDLFPIPNDHITIFSDIGNPSAVTSMGALPSTLSKGGIPGGKRSGVTAISSYPEPLTENA